MLGPAVWISTPEQGVQDPAIQISMPGHELQEPAMQISKPEPGLENAEMYLTQPDAQSLRWPGVILNLHGLLLKLDVVNPISSAGRRNR